MGKIRSPRFPSIVDKSDDTFRDTYISFESFSFPRRKTKEREGEVKKKERKKKIRKKIK